MKADALESILVDRLEAEQDGNVFRLPDDKEVTALLRTGADLLHVQRLKLIEFGDEGTTLVTKQSEYFVDTADVFALKLEGSRIQPREQRPGFR
mgnify:CR=1 FL=1